MPDPMTPTQTAQAMAANDRWADRLAWRPYAAAIATLVGAASDDPGGAVLATAVYGYQATHDLAPDGIIGPKSWAYLSRALAPPESLTGIIPADGPPVPDGLAAVLATFGDPRPLLSPDGTLNQTNAALWERQTLTKATLPFSIPIDPKDPTKGEKTTFYAHHKLVSSFVAVFTEIDRLGLRGLVRSWDGLYNFRPIRGTTTHISLHAWGAAVDLNAATNPLDQTGDMDPKLIDVFAHFGFFWGGNFQSRPDPMHFQYATGY